MDGMTKSYAIIVLFKLINSGIINDGLEEELRSIAYCIDYDKWAKNENEQKCRVCGCTWDNACPGGCSWVEEDLCSQCIES